MTSPPATRSLRFGDPLRRVFLDELRRRVLLPRALSAEWALQKAELTVAVTERGGGPILVLAAGPLDAREPRWVLRQSLEDFQSGDLVDSRAAELALAGHDASEARALASEDTMGLVDAIVEALARVAELRPEHASAPQELGRRIQAAFEWAGPPAERGHRGLGTDLRTRLAREHEDEDPDDQDALPRRPAGDRFEGYDPDALDDEKDHEDPEDGEQDKEQDDEQVESERISSSVRVTRPRPPTSPPPGGRGLARSFVWVLILGGLVAAVAFGAGRQSGDEAAAGQSPGSPSPTGAAAVIADHSVAIRNADSSAVRFDPCLSYEYVVQPGSLAPEDARAEVGAAFAALEEAIGFAFRFAGYSTSRFPHPIDPDNPPGVPILVSYERVADSPALRDNRHEGEGSLPLGGLAVGTPRLIRDGYTVIVGGAMVLDEALTPDQRARILLHELGHLAGLGHAADPGQIMAPAVPDTGPIAYREGDRAGLAEVGAGGGCAMTDAERATVFS